MRKLLYFSVFMVFVASCKFDEDPYSYNREFDDGTFITLDGIVKYISAKPDSAVTISDNYAIIKTEINYIKEDVTTNTNLDSILVFGHCFSELPGAFASPEDSVVTWERLLRYSVPHTSTGSGEPQSFISPDDLGIGTEFFSTLSLHYETDYYIKSYVITGSFDSNGDPIYEHIAYNPKELKITTKSPVDLWVGGTMLEAPADFPDLNYIGGTSFTYDGYLFVAQGHDAGSFGNQIIIHRYDPTTNTWDNPYREFTIGEDDNFTDAVAFVIEDAPLGNQIFHDCVYIGSGRKLDGTVADEFYRLDFEKNLSEPIGEWGEWTNITSAYSSDEYPGKSYNAVAFSINGIGYVGLGQYSNGWEVAEFYKYDPSVRQEGYSEGKWEQIGDFPGGPRAQAVMFQLGDNVYIACGQDLDGNFKKDLWMCRQTTGDYLTWVQKKEFPGTARIEAVGMNIGEMGYVGTGLDADSARSDFYRYNPFTNQWDQRAYFSGEPRYEAFGQGVKISDNDYRGYIGTGWDGTTYFSDVWHYRP
jgi:N-acetylneuraminic acid mutarotase